LSLLFPCPRRRPPLTLFPPPHILLLAAKDGNKHVGLNIDRIKYWLSVGAQPSATVARLLGQAGVIPRAPHELHHGQVKKPDKFKKK
jgi:small subunit ribosomal protein S16